MLMKTAPHSANLATMHNLNYDNRLPRKGVIVMYHFFQLSMGLALEKKLKKLQIIIHTTTESISNNVKCLRSGLICFTVSSI